MTICEIKEILLWCSIINIGILLWWALWLVFAHDFVYRMHSKWYKIPIETFDTIHYAGIGLFKIVIFVFNVVPYIALSIVG